MDERGWYRLEALVASGDVEAATEALAALGVGGVEVQDERTFAEGDLEPQRELPRGRARLIVYLEVEDRAGAPEAARLEALQALESAAPGAEVESFAPFEDRDWATKWMEFFEPALLSPRVRVGPPWESFEAPPGGAKIVIEPGMAFGTGTHETTRLCAAILDGRLAALDRAPDVLDVGCGTGILSILARRLGARSVRGVDVDAEAVAIARTNLEVNGVDASVQIDDTPVGALDGVYDLVVANILAHILARLAEDLRARVTDGGELVLSGIIDEDLDEIERHFLVPGWTEIERRREGLWWALRLRRESTSTESTN